MDVNRRQVMVGGAAAVVTAAMLPARRATAAPAGASAVLVAEGSARSRILLVPGASPEVTHAATTLADYVEKATGVRLPIVTTDPGPTPAGVVEVCVGWMGPGIDDAPELATLDVDGFLIEITDGRVVVVGGADAGTRFGVNEFLERHVGVRWLMPGELGEDVPALPSLAVPASRIVEEPTYLGRAFWPLTKILDVDATDWSSTDEKVVWAARNRLRNRSAMPANHTLFRIFPPSLHADPNKPETYRPEFYPVIGGVHRLPAASSRSNWQPHFGEQATVDHAIQYVIDWFDAKPARPVVTLGINDGGGSFDDRDLTPGLVNSVGMPSASEAFYTWLNKVVTGVLALRPDLSDKKVATIAYNNVLEAPSFPIHPNIVPMIVGGLWLWADQERGAQGRALAQKWFDSGAEETGFYDWMFGHPFNLPKISLSVQAAAYSYGAAHNARYSWTEIPLTWVEGPKAWVCARLLWNPTLDAGTLVAEWCRRMAGDAAAPFLRAYVAIWERFWTETILGSDYFVNVSHGAGAGYDPAEYLALVGEAEVIRARELLEQCRARTVTDQQGARIDLMLDVYRFSEASGIGYPKPVAALNPGSARTLVRDIETNLDRQVAAAASRSPLLDEFDRDPRRKFTPRPNYGAMFSGFNGDAFWRLADQLQAAPTRLRTSLLSKLDELAANPDPGRVHAARFARLLGEVHRGTASNVLIDSDFSEPTSSAWTYEGFSRVVTPDARSSDGCARHSSGDGRILQSFPWTGGLLAGRAHFRFNTPAPTTITSLGYYLLDATGAIRMRLTQPLRTVQVTGSYYWVGVLEDIPATINGYTVAGVRVFASVAEASAPVLVDDIEIYAEQRG